MCLYVESGLRWRPQLHHEDMRPTERSSYYPLVVVDSRDTTESRWAGASTAEKEPDWQTTERADERKTTVDFERRGAADVEDPCCVTIVGRDVETVADSESKGQGLVRLWNTTTGECCLQRAQLFIVTRCDGACEGRRGQEEVQQRVSPPTVR